MLSSFRVGKYNFCRKGSMDRLLMSLCKINSLYKVIKISKTAKRDSFSDDTAKRVVFTATV